MDALYLLAILGGIVWLFLWTFAVGRGRKPSAWSPFTIRDPVDYARQHGDKRSF